MMPNAICAELERTAQDQEYQSDPLRYALLKKANRNFEEFEWVAQDSFGRDDKGRAGTFKKGGGLDGQRDGFIIFLRPLNGAPAVCIQRFEVRNEQ
jgi:hypothetical protein